nr:peptidase S16 [Anaerolineae bacterium]
MDALFRLPLFPLHTVLFPGQPILIHVFESRYRHLVARCLEEDADFGVVLIRKGREVGGLAVPHAVGTTAKIVRYRQIEKDQMQLVAVGQHRFRIFDLVDVEPYLEALAVLWPWALEPAPSHSLRDLVGEWLRRYVAALADTVPAVLSPEALPHDATALGVLAAVVLQVPLAEKQALLETPTAAALLSQVGTLLRRQTHIAEQTNVFQPVGPYEFERISWN